MLENGRKMPQSSSQEGNRLRRGSLDDTHYSRLWEARRNDNTKSEEY